MKKFYVYELVDLKGNPFYIGKGMKYGNYNRLQYHKNHWNHNNNRKLKNKIAKIGGVFNTKILLESENEKECLDLEVSIIKQIGLQNLCNLTLGGEGICGYKHTHQTKLLMSRLAYDPHRIKQSKNNLIKATLSNIGKRKISKHHDYIHELYKTKTTTEISKILKCALDQVIRYIKEQGWYIPFKNKKLSSSHKQKLANITKKRMKPTMKPVSQFTKKGVFVNRFDGAPNACLSLGKPAKRCSEITNVCNGNRKTAFRFNWKFI